MSCCCSPGIAIFSPDIAAIGFAGSGTAACWWCFKSLCTTLLSLNVISPLLTWFRNFRNLELRHFGLSLFMSLLIISELRPMPPMGRSWAGGSWWSGSDRGAFGAWTPLNRFSTSLTVGTLTRCIPPCMGVIGPMDIICGAHMGAPKCCCMGICPCICVYEPACCCCGGANGADCWRIIVGAGAWPLDSEKARSNWADCCLCIDMAWNSLAIWSADLILPTVGAALCMRDGMFILAPRMNALASAASTGLPIFMATGPPGP
mmetsp:Transcript_6010/g.11917  ORF Transcript_6010/g.11917 Transcript_6010/m.11917 type:complete len:261 (+) Transcript_6010:1299-2081(+)